jgi:alcohol dehydrogenase/propanol-preferring alcohol dehydrogenase
MATMRAVQVGEPGGELELVERDVPAPASDEALIRVNACGICHSDSYAVLGAWPGITHPLVPT